MELTSPWPEGASYVQVPQQSFPGQGRGQEQKKSPKGQHVVSEGGILRAEVGEKWPEDARS